MNDTINVACPSCGLDKSKNLATVKLSPIGIESSLMRCAGCQLAYVSPRPTLESEKNFYATKHYELEDENSWRVNRLPFFKWALELVASRSEGRKLLDVGCGGGFFMDLARSNGWEVEGTEISEGGIRQAQGLKLKVVKGELGQAGLKKSSYSVVTLWNVLDQMMDPKNEIETVFKLVEPGGLVALRVSNLTFHLGMHRIWNFLQRTPLAGRLKNKPTVFHLEMFDERSMTRFLMAAGFHSVTVKNSLLDGNNEVLRNLFTKTGARAVACCGYLIAELVRGLSGGLAVIGPSLFVIARKPHE